MTDRLQQVSTGVPGLDEVLDGGFVAGISYLADNVVYLRYLKTGGELRKVIGVLKKRVGDFERTLREFAITSDGIVVGDPLTGLRGGLRGEPEFADSGVRSNPGNDRTE